MFMNFGCGSVCPEGWVNVDKEAHPGVTLKVDIRDGLHYTTGSFDGIVANHSLSDLDHHELVPALRELRRVLKPGGVLRILVPDLLKAFEAYRGDDPAWFPLGDDLPSIDERLCTFIPWFGTVRSVWTPGYAFALLTMAGFPFSQVCPPHVSKLAPGTKIVELDDRDRQALIVEAAA
jgi:predicted SAM-dependent methyltransferase